jgi:Cof subfamily protein (haloacid dehalogenase superfamily)
MKSYKKWATASGALCMVGVLNQYVGRATMFDIKAIVLDLDGTLLNSDKLISPRNCVAITKCYELGIHIVVATARPPRAADKFMKDLPFVDYKLFYNGALISCASKQVKRHISIPADVSQQIIQFISSTDPHAMLSFEVNDAWYTSILLQDSQRSHLGIGPADPSPEIVDSDFINSLSPTKILVSGYDSWDELVAPFGNHVNVISTDGGTLVQIMHKLASKENAVQWVLDEIEVSKENVMVFGDDYNDLGLFRVCGIPIAMGNGVTELKKLAKHVTESNDNDGVAVALEKFVLRIP